MRSFFNKGPKATQQIFAVFDKTEYKENIMF